VFRRGDLMSYLANNYLGLSGNEFCFLFWKRTDVGRKIEFVMKEIV
jgi:hypothetical protein